MRVWDPFAIAIKRFLDVLWPIVGFAALVTLIGLTLDALSRPLVSYPGPRVAIAIIGSTYLSLVSVRFYYQVLDVVSFDFVASARAFFSLLIEQVLALLITVVGLALLVIPGVYVGTRLSFAAYPVLVEGSGPVRALRRSWVLTRGRFWLVLGFRLVQLVPLASLAAILLALAFLVRVSSGPTAIALAYGFVAAIALFALLYVLVFSPVVSIAEASLYRLLERPHKAHKGGH